MEGELGLDHASAELVAHQADGLGPPVGEQQTAPRRPPWPRPVRPWPRRRRDSGAATPGDGARPATGSGATGLSDCDRSSMSLGIETEGVCHGGGVSAVRAGRRQPSSPSSPLPGARRRARAIAAIPTVPRTTHERASSRPCDRATARRDVRGVGARARSRASGGARRCPRSGSRRRGGRRARRRRRPRPRRRSERDATAPGSAPRARPPRRHGAAPRPPGAAVSRAGTKAATSSRRALAHP